MKRFILNDTTIQRYDTKIRMNLQTNTLKMILMVYTLIDASEHHNIEQMTLVVLYQ